MSELKRLLVLGIDSASPALLRQWAADGSLPNIASLLSTGLAGDTRGDELFYVHSTWPSFYTGVNPARHGIHTLDPVKRGAYHTELVGADELGRRKACWEVISEAGRRVVVLDVPISRLSPGLNGTQIVEWRTHDVIFGTQTTPASLKARILQRFGEHPTPAPCDAAGRSVSKYRRFADSLISGAATRARLTNELLAETPWDFAIQVFNEAHCAGHQLWHFHDPAHPAYDEAVTQANGDLLRSVYVAIDAAIGDIVRQVEPGTTIVVMTLHSMSYAGGASWLLRDMLIRLGAMAPPASSVPTRPATYGDRIRAALRAAYHHIPESIRRPLYNIRSRISAGARSGGPTLAFDPLRSKCFYVELGPQISGIRLNLIGREPTGTIAPGADANTFVAELTAQLMEFVHPDSGRPVVLKVHRTADLFQGAELDALPDLIVQWDLENPYGSSVVGNGAGSLLRVQSPRTGVMEVVNDYCRTGDHRAEGMFIARGSGLAPGELGRVVSTLDLAPTFAALLGTEMPDVDGKVIPELLGG